MPRSDSQPTRILPTNPHLEQLRKQAKDLLRSYLSGDPAVIAEVQRFEQGKILKQLTLVDAQRVLARMYGFASWNQLKQHVEGVNVEAFCRAVDAGDVATMRFLAQACPELVNRNRGGEFGEMNAIHFSVLNRDAAMTHSLMELGADAHQGVWPHRDATEALTMARERGYDDIVAIIEQEEERRCEKLSLPGSSISPKTDEIQTAILQGQNAEALRILQSDLTLIGATDANGKTALHLAGWKHDPDLVFWLLERGALANARDAQGHTPLDYAAFVAGWSAHGRDFCFLENSRVEPARFQQTVSMLRSRGAELTPRSAVAIGDQTAVRLMHCENRLRNEIHLLRGGLLSIAVRVNRIELVSLLLDLGFDPDESTTTDEGSGGRSWGMPLWFTAMCGRPEIAELLLDRGADVNAIDYACGDSMCTAEATGDEQMQALLRARGARITVERIAGEKDRETARAILDGTIPGHSLNVVDPSPIDLAEQMLWAAGRSDPEIVRMCLPYIHLDPDDPWWNYVLMHATLPESFRLILEHGVEPDVAASSGYSILHHLATRDVKNEEKLILATMLLDAGASLTKRDSLLKSTPLGWACRWGQSDLVQLCLNRGADPVEADAESWATPLAWAAKGGYTEIAELLRSNAQSQDD